MKLQVIDATGIPWRRIEVEIILRALADVPELIGYWPRDILAYDLQDSFVYGVGTIIHVRMLIDPNLYPGSIIEVESDIFPIPLLPIVKLVGDTFPDCLFKVSHF